MGQVIPRQHPAVVLKSHYKALRALLAVALVAIVALATTVVILANDDNATTSSSQPAAKAAPQPQTQQQLPAGTRFDGGPDEGTRGLTDTAQGFKARAGGPPLIARGKVNTSTEVKPPILPSGNVNSDDSSSQIPIGPGAR